MPVILSERSESKDPECVDLNEIARPSSTDSPGYHFQRNPGLGGFWARK